MERGLVDQGLVTGLTLSVDYAMSGMLRKTIEDIADQLAGTAYGENDSYEADVRQRRFTMALDALAIGASYYAKKKYPNDGKSIEKAAAHTAAEWTMYSSAAGLAVGAMQEIIEAVLQPKDKDGKRRTTKVPVGVIAGGLLATYLEYQRQSKMKKNGTYAKKEGKPLESMAMGVGVFSALAAIAGAERLFADVLSDNMKKLFPGSEDFWWKLGHTTAIVGTGLGIASLLRHTYRKIEEVATEIEPAYLTPPTSTLASGGPESLVSWDTLSVQGRRYVSGAVTKAQIKDVMGQPALKEPIRVYVGLDSAEDETARTNLAMAELERTKAFDREMIMLVSPTGTGYVNYVAVEAAEMMSRGDMASVALQYSKRPSPMSLDRVPEGRRHFRLMVKAISERIAQQPEKKRPKLVLFGESLGAWTSQDAFIDQGTDGLVYGGVDRALWIGSPYGSKWKEQALGKDRPNVNRSLVGKFNDIGQLNLMQKKDREALRYVMITHDNDPVALFGANLIVQKPVWLGDPENRAATVSHTQQYTSPGTFLLTLVDMKNAMNVIPGQFEASGHDYRADLAEFVSAAFGLPVTRPQMKRIEAALRQNEKDRAELLNDAKKKK
jgi:uncharacterized membrane protein